MKNWKLCWLILFPFSLWGQEQQTLFDEARVVGGFGGPIMEFSTINGETGVAAGGGGAVIVNDFFIGGFGMGGAFAEQLVDSILYDVSYGYGGLWLGYTPQAHKLFHSFVSLKIAWGGTALTEDHQDFDYDDAHSDDFFTLIPEVGAEVNVFRWFRIAGTLGYRWVDGISKVPGLNDKDYRSLTGSLVFRFGGFGQ